MRHFTLLISLSTVLPLLFAQSTGASQAQDSVRSNMFSCKNAANTFCVDSANSAGWTGRDVGEWINSAYAALPSPHPSGMIQATIIVEPNPQGCYSFAIPINFGERGKVVTLQGGAPMTCMIYAAKSGTAVTFNFGGTTAGTIHPRGFGMRDIDLIGPHGNQFNCAGLGDTNTTGLLLGGTNGAEGFKFDGGRIACFNTDVRYSSYSAATEFRNFSLAA